MTIYCYSTTDEYGAFSNFARFGVDLDGVWWPTTEHFFKRRRLMTLRIANRLERRQHQSWQRNSVVVEPSCFDQIGSRSKMKSCIRWS